MAQPNYSDVSAIDGQLIEKAIGDNWLYDSKIIATNAVDVDSRPIPSGTGSYYARERDIQDVAPEAVSASGTISPYTVTHTKVTHPRVWRYGNLTYSDVIKDIDALEYEEAAVKLRRKAVQDLDSDIVAVIKGIGETLTGAQYDATGVGVIDLDQIVDTMALLGDRGLELQGGIAAGRSALYFKLLKAGLVAMTANTFGLENQTRMVQNGVLPMNVLGMSFIPSDKFANLGSSQYYLYLISARVLTVRGAGQPMIETARLAAARQFGWVVNMKHDYGIGMYGVNFKGSLSEVISDTDLATAANWELKTQNVNQVGIARLKTKTA
jgi:hypothetical protein